MSATTLTRRSLLAALARLLAGNRRFASGCARHPRQTPRTVREPAAGQDPFAVVLGCADSRVPPEVVFDQGLGDVFDNRVEDGVVANVRAQAAALVGRREIVREHVESGELAVVGARYDLDTGRVTLVR